ncbi:MAG TPA: type 1 glutamine amidotransferase domain-containing protein [Desulfuromonadales bacterium]|nr:type 1 glutamine amidotransferase domain-containing protein [Desulfuromonadales bacterium]
MSLKGKKVAILAEEQYEDLELWYPLLRLKEEGAEITVVGAGAKSYASKHGYTVKTDRNAQDIHEPEFDAVIIPGGYAPDHMRRHEAMVNFVRACHEEGKVVAAICHAGWMLASAGILKGKKVTGFFAIRDDLVNAGAEYLDEEVVRDGKLITSRVPSDLPAFCRTIIEALKD